MSQSQSSGDSLGRIHDALSHPTRRALLHTLRGVETTTVETVADDLVESDVYRVDGGVRHGKTERVEVALHHWHLPMLANAGILDYDSRSRTIEMNRTTDVAYELLGR